MNEKNEKREEKYFFCHKKEWNICSSTIYTLWVIGAGIYFIGKATTFWIWVLWFLKALVRPIFLVQGLLKFLGIE